MTRPVFIATIIAALALVPVALWMNDFLYVTLAGLIPFYIDWKNGELD